MYLSHVGDHRSVRTLLSQKVEQESVELRKFLLNSLREALTGESTAIPVEDALYTEPINALNNLLVDFGNPLWKRQFLVVGVPEDGNAGMGLSE